MIAVYKCHGLKFGWPNIALQSNRRSDRKPLKMQMRKNVQMRISTIL